MKLSDYIAKSGIKRQDFATLIGVSQGYVTQLCQGVVWPGREVAMRIAEVTGGAVTPNDFIKPVETIEGGRAPSGEVTA